MALVGYEPHPSGTGSIFHDDSGRSVHLLGPEAENLKSWIDRTRPADARLASNAPAMGAADPGINDAISGFAAQETRQQLAPPVAHDAPPPMPVARTSSSLMANPPQTEPVPVPIETRPAPVPASAVTPVMDTGESAAPQPEASPGALYAADAIRRGVYVPGRAAITKEQLEQQAASRVPIPVTETVSGALPETDNEKAERLEHEKSRELAIDAARSELNAANAERIKETQQQSLDAQRQASQLSGDLYDSQRRQQAADAEWRASMANLQKEQDAVTQMKVDPSRLFHGKTGAVNAISSAIAVGLGAFGSSLARSPNYAHQIVQASIDRDIAAQEDEIRRKGANAQNAMANFAKTYGLTLDEAREAVRLTQNRFAASMVTASSARLTSIDAKAKAAAMLLDFENKIATDEANFAQLHKGRITTQYAMQSPQKGSGGGFRPLTPKETAEAVKTGLDVNKLTGATGDPDQIRAQAEARKAQQGEESNVQEYGKRKRDIEQVRSTLTRYIEAMGGAVQKDGKVEWRDVDIPDTGFIGGRTPAIRDDARNVEQLRDWLMAQTGKKLSGASVSPQQEERIKGLLTGTNEAAARRGAEILLQETMDENVTNDASFGEKVVKQFESNKAQTGTRRRKEAEANEIKPAGIISPLKVSQ